MDYLGTFKKLKVISIDPSLRSTGVYYSKQDITATLKGRGERFDILKEHLDTWLTTFCCECDLVLVEDYAFSRSSRSVTTLGEVGGIIRACATLHNVPVVEIPNTFWKFHSGFGKSRKKLTNPEKESYIEYGKTIVNMVYTTTDEVDARLIYAGVENALRNNAKDNHVMVNIKKALDNFK